MSDRPSTRRAARRVVLFPGAAMDDGEALIRAIRANRDDDTPRLVYADWLEEQGDSARAEFIRVQCWLSAHTESHPDWEANWQREQELLGEHGGNWAAPLTGYLTDGECDRGFPTRLWTTDPLEFTWVVGELARMTATDRLAVCGLSDADVGVLGRCEGMTAIRELETNADIRGLTTDGLDRLVRSPHLQQLRRLDLSGADLPTGHPDAVLLTREPVLPELENVHLGQSWPADVSAVVALLDSPHRKRLRRLTVPYLTPDDVVVLCRCPALARMTHLDIGWCATTDVAARALAECPYLDRIALLAYAGSTDTPPLSPPARDRLRERFGDRIVLDPMVYVVGPEQAAYRRRVLTGRRR